MQALTKKTKVNNKKKNPYSGYRWNSALDWVEQNKHEYIWLMGLKYIPNAKVGETQYEFAYYEPSNRGDAYCGRGLVGMRLIDCEEDMTKSVEREELLELFPISNTTKFDKLYNQYDQYNTEEDYDLREEKLIEIIKHLFEEDGFRLILPFGY